MTRMILFPLLLASGLAFAAEPTPAPPATPPPTTAPAKPAMPTAPAATTPTGMAAFREMDKNKDDMLEKSEIVTVAQLDTDLGKYDTNKDGKLSRAEFDVWAKKVGEPPALFDDLDMNKDGVIEKVEVTHIAVLDRDFSAADTNKDGKLSKTEYTAWIEKQKPA